jgi:signal transduction histidine kinase
MGKPLRTLIVEDSHDDTLLVLHELQRGGYTPSFERVETAASFSAALKKQVWDIVIADYVMPNFSGPDALKLLQKSDLDLPFIIVSGKIGEDTAVTTMKAGAHDYIMKNNLTRLAAAVERELHEAEIRRERRRMDQALRKAHEQLEIRVEERTRELADTNRKLQFEVGERKRAEKVLQNYAANFRKVITRNADSMLVVNKSGIVRFVNPAAEALFECRADDILDKPFSFPVVAGETTEIAIMQKGGGTAVAEMRVVETEWEGESAYLASLRDITKRKKVEDTLRELDRMKSEFISNISHELRSPLHSIRGFTKLLLADKVPNPETQKEFLTIIDKQSERLGIMINGLLDMSRLESGRFTLQKQSLSINEIIRETIDSFYSLASEKHTVINDDIPATLPEIEADGERLRQVMVNLLSNAMKFSNDGSSITVKSQSQDSELLVQVIDQGTGIPEEAMPHIFERFYRARDSMARGGAGLGLYISKQIIEAHGGRIWAESKVGQGSTFSFTLPLNQTGGNSDE